MPVTPKTSARRFENCTSPAASCCPTLSTSAAHARCSIWVSRRSLPPAPALPGPIGKADNRITLDDVCGHLTALCAAVDLPVNADFEGGFAHEAAKVGANVARAVKTGVAGLSIEDSTGDAAKPLYERGLAIERIKAARAAIDADKSDVLLTGRCEGFLVGQPDLAMVIDRLNAYSQPARIAFMRRASGPKNRSRRS